MEFRDSEYDAEYRADSDDDGDEESFYSSELEPDDLDLRYIGSPKSPRIITKQKKESRRAFILRRTRKQEDFISDWNDSSSSSSSPAPKRVRVRPVMMTWRTEYNDLCSLALKAETGRKKKKALRLYNEALTVGSKIRGTDMYFVQCKIAELMDLIRAEKKIPPRIPTPPVSPVIDFEEEQIEQYYSPPPPSTPSPPSPEIFSPKFVEPARSALQIFLEFRGNDLRKGILKRRILTIFPRLVYLSLIISILTKSQSLKMQQCSIWSE